jgi:hypothetical protein
MIRPPLILNAYCYGFPRALLQRSGLTKAAWLVYTSPSPLLQLLSAGKKRAAGNPGKTGPLTLLRGWNFFAK